MRIITPGAAHHEFFASCKECGCRFAYVVDDTRPWGERDGLHQIHAVNCPHCKVLGTHDQYANSMDLRKPRGEQ